MKKINHGFYQVKIRGHTRAPLLCRWSGKLNSSALQRCPKLIAIKAIEHWAKAAIKCCNARLSPRYVCLIMMVRISYLSGCSQRMPTVHSRAGDRRGILTPASLISQTVRALRESLVWPCQSPPHTPQLHYTNKHLKHSKQNGIHLCVVCSVQEVSRHLLSLPAHSASFWFYCLSYARWQWPWFTGK